MCIAPNTLEDGTQIACRKCWQCRQARVDDLVGRGIAEMRTSVAAHVVSLTYGRGRDKDSRAYGEAEHERAVVLTYSDVQKFLKLLRRHGYPCRYLVTGEYGSEKGRAHWHVCLFWEERVPPGIRFEENWMFARYDDEGEPVVLQDGSPAMFWPHGHTYWKTVTYESLRYNLKYVLKQMGQGAVEQQAKKEASRFPPLGTAYFADMARRLAEQSLVPIDPFYTFPEALRRNGERVQFKMAGAVERDYLLAYEAAWRELHGSKPIPYSEYFNEWQENYIEFLPDPELRPFHRARAPGGTDLLWLQRSLGEPVPGAADDRTRDPVTGLWSWPKNALQFDVAGNGYYHTARDGRRWYWRLEGGKWKWLNPELEKIGRSFKRDWDGAVSAARKTDKPWLIDMGRKVREIPRGLSHSGPRNKNPRRILRGEKTS